jgi:diphosphomevalonate decarboxylase
VRNRITARAFSNIALIKYWGKLPTKLNSPATPSISLAVSALKTETTVCRIESGRDKFILNGKPTDMATSQRLREYLDIWRKQKLIAGHFLIESRNNFPTGAGLASSASGYAALAVALGAFTETPIDKAELSRLARIGSGSAARSVVGGLAFLPDGKNPAAKLIMPADKIPWGMVMAIVESKHKKINSRTGMGHSAETSPYYQSWIKSAKSDCRKMLRAIYRNNLAEIGITAEANALAMHACMMSARPPLVYWHPATVEIITRVPFWRKSGLETYFTIDAGPNVILLGRKPDLLQIARRVKRIAGVKDVVVGFPAGGAEVIRWN